MRKKKGVKEVTFEMEHLVILLVEDSDDDVAIIRKAFRNAKIENPLHVVRDGEAAVAYLAGTGKYSLRDEYPLPALVLLDLKLPGMDGFEVLRWIRQTPGLSTMRVVVLTSSDQIRDVNAAYELGANSFMVKEMDFQNTVELARLIKDFWLAKAKVPESSRPEVSKKVRKRDA
jgi:CheY-like chemotaxis protein